jgi:hypothetical protein
MISVHGLGKMGRYAVQVLVGLFLGDSTTSSATLKKLPISRITIRPILFELVKFDEVTIQTAAAKRDRDSDLLALSAERREHGQGILAPARGGKYFKIRGCCLRD